MNLFRRLLMHALALAVPLCTLAQDTESESNNSTGTANPLTLGVSMTGSMGACSPTDNSADFFVTTIPSQGVLRVQSSMSTTGASPVNLNFRVLSSGGSLLGTFPLQAGASGVAVNDEFRFTCRGQGQHFIEVQFPGGAQCINYTFTYDIVAPVFANDAETNNTTGTAVPIAVNTWSPGQVNFTPGDNNDYFQLDLPSNGVLNIEWEGEHTGTADPSTATLQLYTNAGSLLQTWTVPVGANSIPATDLVGILCRGNTSFYFLRVQSSVCGTSYRFRYNVTAPLFANDAESNNSTGTATTIPVNTFTEGHIDFYYGDNNDYYRLDLPSNGVLRVDVDAEHAGAGVGELLTVQLLSNGGSLLQTWTAPVGANSAAASSLLSMTCRGDQNHYFLRITSGVCGASYRFRYRVDAPIFSNDVEPNNSTGEATTLPIGTETQGQINFHYGNNTDYYRVDLPGNGILNVQWQAEHAGATAGQTATIQLRNSGGSLLQNWTVPVGSDGIPESANVSITCRGNSSHYFLNIESGICGTSYKLSYTLTPPIYGINPVAGTGLGDAPTIVLNAANVEGQLNFYQGPTDAYYRIVLSATTDLSIGFLAEHAGASNGNFTARLLSSGGSLLLDQTIVAGANSAPVASTANYGSRAAGTYFLRLFGAPCGTSLRLLCNDADGDGVCNASDLCPGTPNGEGVNNNGCACSQLTVDDNDVCTLDECLNGNVTNTFQDADNDLTCDANDGCPNDPNKIAPGQCGCGVPDTDTDGDGLADCVDPCPALANAVPGGSCNDNNACTINDVYDANCNCAGTIQDTDGDGVCDANDPCPLIANAVPGGSCNDGNACTINDVYDANCNCAGTIQDTDGDGVCDANDPCPLLANLAPGDACDDGNANTINDLVNANCVCAGTLLNDDCEGVPGGPAQPGTACNDNNACTINDVYDANCNCAGTIQDTDGDGVCDANDPCPSLANLAPGDACDDGNANTINDLVNANCVCAGTLLDDDCEGVPGGPAQPGTACNDNNACTINDVYDANCNCAGTIQDTDGDGVCDANDPCPLLANLAPGDACDDGNANTINDLVNANCVCAGTLLDDDCEGVPGGPAQPGTACNDNNACTINDVYDANCNCAGTIQDTDGDGVCDANDPCPLLANLAPGDACDDGNANTINDLVNANCVCAGTLLNDDCEGVPGGPAQPGTACNDNNACTINDVYDANCNCAGTIQDTDGDGVCDANDSCPNVVGQIGSPCDDGNASTINDQLNAACQCVGQPVGPGCDFNELEITVVNDAVSNVTYEIREQGTNTLSANGTVNPPAGSYTLDICLPDGCYYLAVTDDGGDGIVGGGYVLRLATGERLIDNTGNMTVGASQIDGDEGFCLPIGTDRFKFSSCDKLDWRFGQVVAAETNPLVSAQYGVNNANSGYQIWWYDPNGGYSFKRFQSHNTTNSLPANPARAAHFVINGWIGNQLQQNVLYNMKVRSRVNGTYSAWGPACNFTLNEQRALCPLAKLNDVPGSQYLSCSQSRNWGPGNIVSARPVSRPGPNGSGTQNANRYQFRFRLPNESLVAVRTTSTYHLPLNWSANPLVPGTTYLVDVRASFDNGATWCTDFIQPSVDPWGEVCTLTILGGGSSMAVESGDGQQASAARMAMYPNPNRGDQLFVSLSAIEAGVETVSVDIYDAFGKRVSARTIAAQDAFVNSVVDLNGLANGMYMVSIGAGSAVFNERLVIQQ